MAKAFDRGVTSFKVFMTYDIRLTDEGFLDVLEFAAGAGALRRSSKTVRMETGSYRRY